MNKNELLVECNASLKKVTQMTSQRLSDYPKYSLYIYADKQIKLIKKLLDTDTVNKDSLKEVDIGTMAVKELDNSEPDYAEAIYELTHNLRLLAES